MPITSAQWFNQEKHMPDEEDVPEVEDDEEPEEAS